MVCTTFWWQPTHAARAETACGLCRARRRKTSVAKLKVPKPSACRFSREQPPARVERAQQEQDFTAQKHAPFRLWRLGKQQAVCPRLRTPLQPPPAPGARFLGLSFSAANDNADFLPSKTELTRKYSNPLFVFHSASSRTEPPALRNFSISPAARLSRIASRIVQRLSKVCSSMRGCCSLTTRMMAFIAT